MFARAIALLVAVSCVSVGALQFSACPDDAGTGSIVSLSSPQFGDNDEIVLQKGRTYTFDLRFTAGEDSQSLRPEIFALIAGIPAPWAGVPDPACNSLVDGTSCPIAAGDTYSYSASIEVLSSYPSVSLTFQWALVASDASGNKGANQVCFRMPARIVA